MAGLTADRIVVPVDFSDLSFNAVDRALEITGEADRLDVIHVLAYLPAAEYGNFYGTMTDQMRIEQVDESLRRRFAEDRFEGLRFHVTIGDPGREIAAFAEREKADLIVLPSHGYGFVKHMLLGSVAERVVRLAHCPVLVLRS